MGYSFKIGNAKPEFSKDYDYLDAWWEVEGAANAAAPVFPNDEMTGNTNMRSPSYSVWSDFCKTTGISAVFYDERLQSMRCGHPGTQLITLDDYNIVKDALARWQETATLPPGFDGFPVYDPLLDDYVSPDEGKYDPILARLIWVEYWMKWALDNCETPAIRNT